MEHSIQDTLSLVKQLGCFLIPFALSVLSRYTNDTLVFKMAQVAMKRLQTRARLLVAGVAGANASMGSHMVRTVACTRIFQCRVDSYAGFAMG